MQQLLLCMSQYRFLNNHAFNAPPVENYFSAASALSNSVLPIYSSMCRLPCLALFNMSTRVVQ